MATVVLGAMGSVYGPGGQLVGGLLGSYVDQNFLFPALFGKEGGPKPTALEGLQLSTTDPGAPRWEVFGSRAWVPCHFLWTRGVSEEASGDPNAVGKGARPFVLHVRADVGLAVCDGPINRVEVLYANSRPFWAREFNRSVLQDSEWNITAGTGPSAGRLVIEARDAQATDFTSFLSVSGLVLLESVLPATLLGPYRVADVRAHTSTGRTRVDLTPLRSQTPVAGTAGSAFEPARIRRIDQGCASHEWTWSTASLGQRRIARPSFHPASIPGRPELDEEGIKQVWAVGGVYRFEGMVPPTLDGRYGLVSLRTQGPFTGDYDVEWTPLESQPTWNVVGFSPGTASVPATIIRESGGAFVFYDATQGAAQYLGTSDQPQDSTLAAHEPDPPAHRGIAHFSLSRWTLAPHGNVFPIGITALVRARIGETVASTIGRVCARVMPEGSFDTTAMRQKDLHGYSIPAGITRGQALQPLLAYYGLAVQDRGGVLTFLDERDLPVVPVATRHLNARPVGEKGGARGFLASRIDKGDVPERVLLHYVDPTNEGGVGVEGDGVRAPGSPDRGGRDTLDIDLKPLVVWPHEAKRRARELRRKIQLETHRGQVSLPPGYMDVLASHCVTFQSNNEEQERIPPGTAIAFTTELRDLVPNTVAIEVLFATSGRARLVDNGAGAFEGFPAGVVASPNSIDYSTGEILITCSEDLDDEDWPTILYQYARQWLLRANKATLRGHDFSLACDLVTTTTDDPLPPLPRALPRLGGPLVSTVPPYRVEALDLPSLYPGSLRTVVIPFVAAPEPGAAWRGATVFQSPNGVDRWAAVGGIQVRSPIGVVVGDGLAAGLSSSFVDWETELTVDMPLGETLVSATLEQVGYGENWALCGDRLIAFLEAEPGVGTQWILRGIVHGLRHTVRALDAAVVDGDRFVLLYGLGWAHGLLHEPVGGFAAANRTYYWRVVPGGASITDVATITQLVRGNSARPAPPILEPDDLAVDALGGISLRWWRRSIDETTLFGPSPMPAGEAELYHVLAIDHDQFTTLAATLTEDQAIAASTRRRWVVGGEGMGTTLVDRRISYAAAEITADLAVASGATVGLLVRQIGAAGHSERSDIQTHTP